MADVPTLKVFCEQCSCEHEPGNHMTQTREGIVAGEMVGGEATEEAVGELEQLTEEEYQRGQAFLTKFVEGNPDLSDSDKEFFRKRFERRVVPFKDWLLNGEVTAIRVAVDTDDVSRQIHVQGDGFSGEFYPNDPNAPFNQ